MVCYTCKYGKGLLDLSDSPDNMIHVSKMKSKDFSFPVYVDMDNGELEEKTVFFGTLIKRVTLLKPASLLA